MISDLEVQALTATCPYEQRFIGFLGPDLYRKCIYDAGHSGNHVVIDPRDGRRLEVLAAEAIR
jgi:hypothetical protein